MSKITNLDQHKERVVVGNILKSWRDDPVKFVKDNFGITPDPWQVDFLQAFTTHKRLAGIASKGVGKTTVLAWCILNFISTRPHPKIACTSISFDNLSDGLRSEIAFWLGKSPFLQRLFKLTKTRLFNEQNSETWFCSFRSWSKSADSNAQALTLAGLHADYMLFICDEAGSYPDAIIATAEGALSSGIESKLVLMGNPTDINGPLFKVANTKERNNWYVQHINADPDSPNRSVRVS